MSRASLAISFIMYVLAASICCVSVIKCNNWSTDKGDGWHCVKQNGTIPSQNN